MTTGALFACNATNVGGVYDAQRAETSSKRVMILTRSATCGLDRETVDATISYDGKAVSITL